MDCFMEEVRMNYRIYCCLTLSSKAISNFPTEVYQFATDLLLPTFTNVHSSLVSERLKGVLSKNSVKAASVTGRINHRAHDQ